MLMLKSKLRATLGAVMSETVPQQKRSICDLSFIIRESRKLLYRKGFFLVIRLSVFNTKTSVVNL